MGNSFINSFSFFRNYYDAAKELDDPDRHAFLDAVLQYVFEGITPALSGVAKAMFIICQPSLDKSIARSKSGAASVSEKSNDNQNENKTGTNEIKSKSNDNQNEIVAFMNKEVEGEIEKEIFKNKNMSLALPPDGAENGVSAVRKEKTAADKPPDKPPSANEQRFDAFWQSYPNKTGKKAALSAWTKAKIDAALFEKIMAAIESAKKIDQWQKDNGQYIPNPATWINQGRWDDEHMPSAGRASPNRRGDFANYKGRSFEEAIGNEEKLWSNL